jgi:hypothetical protein
VQDWIGRANIQSTMEYAKVTNARRDDIAKQLRLYATQLPGNTASLCCSDYHGGLLRLRRPAALLRASARIEPGWYEWVWK